MSRRMLLCIAALLGCGRGSTSSAESVTLVVVPVDSIHVIGTSERITGIRDVLPGLDGIVWSLNTTEPFFVGLRADGTVAHALGPAGEGPHEFLSPAALGIHPITGEVWAYDSNRARNALIRVRSSPDDWTEIRLPSDSAPANRMVIPHFAGNEVSRIWLRPGAGVFLMARARLDYGDALEMWNADLVAIDPSGRDRDSPSADRGPGWRINGQIRGQLPIPALSPLECLSR